MNIPFRIKQVFYSITRRKLCEMCGENVATEQIKEPNAEQMNPFEAPMMNVCWECAKFVEWSKEDMVKRVMERCSEERGWQTPEHLKSKSFDMWLLDKYHVQPKTAYASCFIKGKE